MKNFATLQLSSLEVEQINQCLLVLKTIFGKELLGIYLYGSAVAGGLQKYSDIDLFVVVGREVSNSQKALLVKRLLEVSGIYMKSEKRPIEMTIVENSKVNPWQYPPLFEVQYGEWLRGEFEQGNITPESPQPMPDLAILITQVLANGVTIYGKPPCELLTAVPLQDFLRAMLTDLDKLVAKLEYDTRNVLLTLARIWYTLATSKIVSKPEAADWAIAKLPKMYRDVMIRAKLICIGEEAEEWRDLQKNIKPCADFLRHQIDQSVAHQR